ncbi:MAG TPA: hypothetical protein VJ350_04240 [Methanoregula sp.]|nr:hypothetical protein [Methanoregula sp.]
MPRITWLNEVERRFTTDAKAETVIALTRQDIELYKKHLDE